MNSEEEEEIFSNAAQSIAEYDHKTLLEFMHMSIDNEENIPLYVNSENPLIKEHVSKKLKETCRPKDPLKIRVAHDDGPEAVNCAIESICDHFGIPYKNNSDEGFEYVDYVIGDTE